MLTLAAIAAIVPPAPAPLGFPGRDAVLGSPVGPRLATLSRPSALWMIAISHFRARFNAHLRSDYAVWIADSRHAFGPTGRVNVQYSSMLSGEVEPSTTAPLVSSTT